MTIPTATRPEIEIKLFHRFIRWLYRLIFVGIFLGVLSNIIQNFVVVGSVQLPSTDDLRHLWYARGLLEQPIIYVPATVFLLALGIGGFLIDRRLSEAEARQQDRQTAGIATAVAQEQVASALP